MQALNIRDIERLENTSFATALSVAEAPATSETLSVLCYVDVTQDCFTHETAVRCVMDVVEKYVNVSEGGHCESFSICLSGFLCTEEYPCIDQATATAIEAVGAHPAMTESQVDPARVLAAIRVAG